MEQRFGEDFSHVRIHTDAAAACSAAEVGARAYTVGNHIAFGAGHSPSDRRLLAHELAHVVQGAGQDAILRRQPDPKGPHTDPAGARLNYRIVETFKTTRVAAIDAMVAALSRGDQAYLRALGLSSKEVSHLLNRTPFLHKMFFGRAAEFAVERAVRADPLLKQYFIRGPQGWVPRGVGKPDWRIETPSMSIPVELTTPAELERKLAMWRKQTRKGKPKWYMEKGLNVTHEGPPNPTAPSGTGSSGGGTQSSLQTPSATTHQPKSGTPTSAGHTPSASTVAANVQAKKAMHAVSAAQLAKVKAFAEDAKKFQVRVGTYFKAYSAYDTIMGVLTAIETTLTVRRTGHALPENIRAATDLVNESQEAASRANSMYTGPSLDTLFELYALEDSATLSNIARTYAGFSLSQRSAVMQLRRFAQQAKKFADEAMTSAVSVAVDEFSRVGRTETASMATAVFVSLDLATISNKLRTAAENYAVAADRAEYWADHAYRLAMLANDMRSSG